MQLKTLLIQRRRRVGQDLLNEVWDGVLHFKPAPHSQHSGIAHQLAEPLGPLARQAGLVPRLSSGSD